jgi:hypothetical protein
VLMSAAWGGWFWEKLGTYGQIVRRLPAVVRERRRVQALRVPTATDGAFLTGKMQVEGLEHPWLARLANPILSAYWAFACRALRVD